VSPLDAWAIRHHVSQQAMTELGAVLESYDSTPTTLGEPGSEARVQSLVRLEAAAAGVWLTRNNVGAYQDPKSPRWIRYGLANESKQQNAVTKSADLIGFRRRVIVSADVGNVIAQFTSREVKKTGWVLRPNDPHEAAQVRWRDFINSNGGDAAFVSGPGSFIPIKE
jgi:hypothetical protein